MTYCFLPIKNMLSCKGSINKINNKAEIIVFKNCLPSDFNFDEIKKTIQKEAFSNLYKLFQITITMNYNNCCNM